MVDEICDGPRKDTPYAVSQLPVLCISVHKGSKKKNKNQKAQSQDRDIPDR